MLPDCRAHRGSLSIGTWNKLSPINHYDFGRRTEFGVFLDNMMYAKEKAKYIIDHGFPVIENFYSDSLADTPLALCAEKAHLVTKKASTEID